MIDSYGRNIDYIRISVTDRCNLRCIYCMPEEGVALADHRDVLSYEEIEKICRILARMGFTKVKLTGGEPLVRKDLKDLVKQLKQIKGLEKITLTSNGVLLKEAIGPLVQAGISGVNVSLDTLSPGVFREITRRDVFGQVMVGLEEALKYPELSLKVNCVPMGIPGQEILKVADLARENCIHVRFIEMMPIGYGKQYRCLTQDEIMNQLTEAYGTMHPVCEPLGNGPACYYKPEKFRGSIGFISAVSHKFCSECNRIRLTSQGFLKTCLQYDTGRDLRRLLREGAAEETLLEEIAKAILEKPREHHFADPEIQEEDGRMMCQIGG